MLQTIRPRVHIVIDSQNHVGSGAPLEGAQYAGDSQTRPGTLNCLDDEPRHSKKANTPSVRRPLFPLHPVVFRTTRYEAVQGDLLGAHPWRQRQPFGESVCPPPSPVQRQTDSQSYVGGGIPFGRTQTSNDNQYRPGAFDPLRARSGIPRSSNDGTACSIFWGCPPHGRKARLETVPPPFERGSQ